MLAPPAGYRRIAGGATAARRDPVAADVVSVALDQGVTAGRTMSVFEVADLSGQVARVHVPEAGATANGRGSEQHLGRRVGRFPHLVVSVKRGHVPRDVRRHAGDE